MENMSLRGQRIDELSQLRDGWLGNGEGKRINHEVLELVRFLVSTLEAEVLPLPAIYPMADETGMSLAWRFENRNVTLRIHSPSEIELSRFNPKDEPILRRRNREVLSGSILSEVCGALIDWLKEK